MSWPLVQYVLTAAFRDRLLLSLIVLMALGTSLSVFMGSAAISEKDQFALVFAGGGLRITGMLALTLFIVFYIRRSFDAKDVEFLLARPISRVEFVVSYAFAFCILAIGVALIEGISLYILSPDAFGAGHLLWVVSVMVENIIMVCTALFFAMMLSSAAMAAMASFGLYVLGRMMGQILGIVASGKNTTGESVLEPIMQGISAITPRLDLMGQGSWLVYGPEGDVGFAYVFAQAAVFSFLLVVAALIDLIRRQF